MYVTSNLKINVKMVSIIKNDLSKNYEKSKNRDCLGKHDYNKNPLVNIFLLCNTMIL